MSEWQKVKIGDVCTITKGAIGIQKAIAGKYPMVTLAEERATHNEFQFDCDAVIVPLVSSTGHGHASMKRVHYQEGKFALGSILCAVVPNDSDFLNPKYLHIYLSYLKEKLFVPLMRGAANVSLSISNIKNVEIIVPPIEKQIEIIELEKKVRTQRQKLDEKNNDQNNYLASLRQQILQDAISGKLTVDWRTKNPDIEPAIKLLEEIKAEKEKPVAEKKNKKEKPLPKITYDEIPFELPDKWEWVRLDKLGDFFTGNSINETIKKTRYSKINTGYPYIGTKDVYFNGSGVNYDSGVKIPFDEKGFRLAKTNTILFCIEGGSSGKKYAITNQVICFGNKLLASVITELINVFYVYSFYQSRCFLDQYKIKSKGLRGGVSVNKFKEILIPLPPFAEQKAIVAKVEKLMEHVSALEEKIKQNKQDAEMLMQSFLVEAFKN